MLKLKLTLHINAKIIPKDKGKTNVTISPNPNKRNIYLRNNSNEIDRAPITQYLKKNLYFL